MSLFLRCLPFLPGRKTLFRVKGKRKDLGKKDLSFLGGSIKKDLRTGGKKKGGGTKPPAPEPKGLRFDVFFFVGVWVDHPFPTFDLRHHDVPVGVFTVGAFVVIAPCADHMMGSKSPAFNYDFSIGPRLVPHLGDARVRQTQFTLRARVAAEQSVLPHLDTQCPDAGDVFIAGHHVRGSGCGGGNGFLRRGRCGGLRRGRCPWLLLGNRVLSLGHDEWSLSYPV
jgi:hypothetical protein